MKLLIGFVLFTLSVSAMAMESVSELLKSYGFTHLVHRTQLSKLELIAELGLLTGDKTPLQSTGLGLGANIPNKAFCYLRNDAFFSSSNVENYSGSSGVFSDGQPYGDCNFGIVIIDLKALDELSYHIISFGENWGNVKDEAYHSGESLDKLSKMIEVNKSNRKEISLGEVVFKENIPPEFITKILLHPKSADAYKNPQSPYRILCAMLDVKDVKADCKGLPQSLVNHLDRQQASAELIISNKKIVVQNDRNADDFIENNGHYYLKPELWRCVDSLKEAFTPASSGECHKD